MTNTPATFLEVRRRFQRETGLPAASLGIQHYKPDGGGYHEGNDLLAAAGRLHTDYSKRETELDRPGSNDACAIDIGRFRVLRHGVWVDNAFMMRWVLAEISAGAPDTLWIREIIYSLDGRTVKRYDRLGIRSTGDSSHRTHEHFSAFRDYVLSNLIPALFNRFWDWVNGGFQAPQPIQRRRARMFLMHNVSQGVATFALVGENTVREWKANDTISTPHGTLSGQALANAYAESLGDSTEKTLAEYAAIKAQVSGE